MQKRTPPEIMSILREHYPHMNKKEINKKLTILDKIKKFLKLKIK